MTTIQKWTEEDEEAEQQKKKEEGKTTTTTTKINFVELTFQFLTLRESLKRVDEHAKNKDQGQTPHLVFLNTQQTRTKAKHLILYS